MAYSEDTEKFLWMVVIANLVGWSLVYTVTFRQILLGWSIITIIVTGLGYRLYPVLADKLAWKAWVLTTFAGIATNYISFSQSVLLEFGFIPVWIVLISITYIFISVYNRENQMMNKATRVTFGISGMAGILAVLVIVTMFSVGYMTEKVAVGLLLSVLPTGIVALLYRRRKSGN